MSTLKDLAPGQSGVITRVGGAGALRQHFLDMGVIPGTIVTVNQLAPLGDPMELTIHGYLLTLRLADAAQIDVRAVRPEDRKQEAAAGARGISDIDHPGYGEGGHYHDKANEHPLPEGTLITFALAGNQNSGKTTLFNQLTGSNQHVGNFPGVTVEGKSGRLLGHPNTEITDLPGIYSLSPYTDEEIVSRQFILQQKPKGIIDIVDATNIERNLYLTMQLMELEVPMVVALNMMDEVRENGGSIDINQMERILGVPVVPISAAKGEGISELVDHALHVAKYQEFTGRTDFCAESEYGGAVHRCLHGIMYLISDHAAAAGLPLRFAATKAVEGDRRVLEALKLEPNEQEMLEHIITQMEQERGLDREAAIADMRYSFISRLSARCVVKPARSKGYERSRRIDRILTGRFTAIPAFIAIMGLVFWLSFNVIGFPLQDLLQSGIDWLAGQADAAMSAAGVSGWLHSLVMDGLFSGVGTVVSFVPIIVTLFIFLSLLEDSGYMARIAFVMDKLLRRIGLSGRSIVPMLIGFGCSVPGVMATRTLPSERDRKMTIMLIPFMSCSAKLPIYALFTTIFFPRHAGLVMVLLYFGGILTGILIALAAKGTVFKGEAVPFVMELPNYRMPTVKTTVQLAWEKTRDFLSRAFSVIFIASLVIWFLENFDTDLALTADPSASILARAAGWLVPLFAPLGLGDWRIVTALIAGFMAKESIVATLSVLIGGAAELSAVFTPLTALTMLVFCLLYTPCVAAISAIRRELDGRQALAVVLLQCAVAWLAALIVHTVGAWAGLA